MEYLTLENIEKALTILGMASAVFAPVITPKIMFAKKVLKQTTHFINNHEHENKELFRQAVNQGFKDLADHINQTVEPEKDFYEGK